MNQINMNMVFIVDFTLVIVLTLLGNIQWFAAWHLSKQNQEDPTGIQGTGKITKLWVCAIIINICSLLPYSLLYWSIFVAKKNQELSFQALVSPLAILFQWQVVIPLSELVYQALARAQFSQGLARSISICIIALGSIPVILVHWLPFL